MLQTTTYIFRQKSRRETGAQIPVVRAEALPAGPEDRAGCEEVASGRHLRPLSTHD